MNQMQFTDEMMRALEQDKTLLVKLDKKQGLLKVMEYQPKILQKCIVAGTKKDGKE